MDQIDGDPDVEYLARLAFLASELLSLLRATSMPDTLAHDLVREWFRHELTIDEPVQWTDLSSDDE